MHRTLAVITGCWESSWILGRAVGIEHVLVLQNRAHGKEGTLHVCVNCGGAAFQADTHEKHNGSCDTQW